VQHGHRWRLQGLSLCLDERVSHVVLEGWRLRERVALRGSHVQAGLREQRRVRHLGCLRKQALHRLRRCAGAVLRLGQHLPERIDVLLESMCLVRQGHAAVLHLGRGVRQRAHLFFQQMHGVRHGESGLLPVGHGVRQWPELHLQQMYGVPHVVDLRVGDRRLDVTQ
jgi:hypothetical protein